MSKVLAFVPVRCGSKSIPLKNIKLFCGKPLVYWNLQALQSSSKVDEIYVATDCSEIKEVVKSFAFSKVSVYDREPENAADKSSTESVMLEFLRSRSFTGDETFILVQATSPLTSSEDFNNAIDIFKSGKFESLLTCARVKKFFWNENGVPINYDYRKRPRRQDFKGVLLENGSFYINLVGNIIRDENRLSGKIGIYEMPEYKSVDIDELDDWALAERQMNKYILNKNTK